MNRYVHCLMFSFGHPRTAIGISFLSEAGGSDNGSIPSPGSSWPFPALLVAAGWFPFPSSSSSSFLHRYLLPWPLLFPLPFPSTLTSHPLLLTLRRFSPPLVSSSFLLSVCVSEGSAPITSYLERGSCSQSGFCLLLGQVISELQ